MQLVDGMGNMKTLRSNCAKGISIDLAPPPSEIRLSENSPTTLAAGSNSDSYETVEIHSYPQSTSCSAHNAEFGVAKSEVAECHKPESLITSPNYIRRSLRLSSEIAHWAIEADPDTDFLPVWITDQIEVGVGVAEELVCSESLNTLNTRSTASLRCGDDPSDATPLEEQMSDADGIWADNVKQNNLLDIPVPKLASWRHSDADLVPALEAYTDMKNSRISGFTEYQHTPESFFDVFDILKSNRFIQSG